MQGETLLLAALNSEHCRMSAEGHDDDGALDPGKELRAAGVSCDVFIRGLLDQGASPDVASAAHGTPLIKTVFMARPDLATLLLEADADANLKGTHALQGVTPLSQAVKTAQVETATLLIKHGANVNEKSAAIHEANNAVCRAMLPVMLAASCADATMCRVLLEAKADPDSYDEDGQTTLQMVSSTDGSMRIAEAFEIAAMLLAHGASVNYADAPATPNRPDAHVYAMKGRSPLFLASGHSAQPDLVRLLLEQVADPNQQADGGLTPLLNAAYNGGAEVCRLLLNSHADAGRRLEGPAGTSPTSPLLQAIECGHENVVRVLTAARPELVLEPAGGMLPIQIAMSVGPDGAACAMHLFEAMQSLVGRVAMPPSTLYTMISLFNGGSFFSSGPSEHHGRTGLTPQQIASLPTRTLSTDEGVEPAHGGQCAICMVEFAANDKLTTLACHHEFHSACVGAWLQLAMTCPLCRASSWE